MMAAVPGTKSYRPLPDWEGDLGSFGERLERERTTRGITLQEIADATKISARMLRALETEDFDKLPGGIFNRGFVRAYAQHLGMDVDEVAADYVAAEAVRRNGTGEPPLAEAETKRHDTTNLLPWLRLVALLLLLAGLGWGLFRLSGPLRSAWQRLMAHQSVAAPLTHAPAPSPSQPPRR